ncbi:CDK-activating kinase assembly factor MAT1 [Salmo trutta]|uniref:CDK-activating kinase assembly factor MAT1 n=1 Tax=Salmo trutta TaxID=8032 RepID=UPI001131391D|nr:CDK-activating kinase assembly factor MAT1-like [Salmo trutta]XP_029585931.1 CDK-activating kinase assembly factor MAT1-like [Salmo trutta]XP_029585932.1 CDK-activating kinase assembly factor MAT1-like [Salmo trutta]XP_029585933.1 CDK-activating kinase assembly factor MAT1-like [Salmo trutta]XP_029585934.1 CDK-activating kinase assembly factor MAT1-like [Salmo trutta]XP_029585935.1 CDK-activating kinase assembly factor MAT1-like [Salmo trutta]XP_029585936.1 CDK-activating kinase assembly f
MEAYQRENRDIIQKNRAKLEELLLLEEQGNEHRSLEALQEEQRQLQARRKSKQALQDKLERAHVPTTILLAQHKDQAAQLETQIEKQKQVVIPMSQTVSLQPVACIEEVLYRYQPINSHTYRTPVPELEQLGLLGYLNHVRIAQPQDMAGGFNSGLVCHQAIQDAVTGLTPSGTDTNSEI